MRRDRRGARHRRRGASVGGHGFAGATCTHASAASCPRWPRAGTSSSSLPVVARGARARQGRAGRRRGRRGHAGPRPDRRAARRALRAPKALAWGRGLPLVPVNHLHGHVASLYLEPDPLEPPFLCLLASGGHTLLVDVPEHGAFRAIGTTLDDAAGEAFDKGARLLGLGYPGGAEIDRLAREGDPEAFEFPVARVPGLDFSFSGVKTALLYEVRGLGDQVEERRADLAASYQRAIVRALAQRTLRGRRANRRRADRDRRRRRRELGAPCRAPGRDRAAARALHRQRRDDRLRRPLRRGDPTARISCAGCLCVGFLSFVEPPCGDHRARGDACSSSASASATRSSARSVSEASSWRGLVGGAQPAVEVGQRVLVVLRSRRWHSGSRRTAASRASRKERRWTRDRPWPPSGSCSRS